MTATPPPPVAEQLAIENMAQLTPPRVALIEATAAPEYTDAELARFRGDGQTARVAAPLGR
jgi:hypothetical protein